jgi:hypothetical protein
MIMEAQYKILKQMNKFQIKFEVSAVYFSLDHCINSLIVGFLP